MLTPDEIEALRIYAGRIVDPVNDFLIQDIARRIQEAGQLTSTAQYQVWASQNLGLSRWKIKRKLRALLRVSRREMKKLLTQTAEVGYRYDLKRLPHARAVPFRKNQVLQQITQAAVALATEDFQNITQTLGMVDPFGRAMPLRDAYRSACDFAFKQVITGATDYNTAVRQASKNIARYGVRTIDYESGVHTSLEAAVRRNIMGGAGLIQEKVSQRNHDDMGADGWEISAHEASAPDHEPIQGRQYSDADYMALNDSLQRRIGTLNCGHAAFPIILGVSQPQYTEDQLRGMKERNAEGVTVDGRHYTAYEATQKQREIERAIRAQKRKVMLSADEEKDRQSARLTRLRQEYRRFSKQVGLRTEEERIRVAGWGRSEAAAATQAAKRHHVRGNAAIGIPVATKDVDSYGNLKYTNSPAQELQQKYRHSVESGMLSPLSGFANYEQLHARVESELVGLTTSNGIVIRGQTDHFLERVIGTMRDPHSARPRSGVDVDTIRDALLNGSARPITTDALGRRSQSLQSDACDVALNPDTGNLIQCNPA